MRKLALFVGKAPKDFSKKVLMRSKEKLKSLNIPAINKFLDDNVQENLRWYKIRDIKESENEVYDFSLPEIENDQWCHSILYNGVVGHQTPKGLNLFYEFWSKAVRESNKNNFFPIQVGWWEVPDRDDVWKERMIADIGIIRFSQEFQTKFLGGQSTLIDSDVLERINFKDPVATKWNGLLMIYKEPVPGGEYVLGVDTGKGTGRDYSVIQILHLKNEFDLEQVAIYRNNLIRPHDFSQICVSIAQYYNNAHMMVENNDIGQSVADSIWHELEYEELINADPRGLGVRSTKKTKAKAMLF